MNQAVKQSATPAVSHSEMTGAIRALAMDAVEKANSGHPGMPMGMADVATVLFREFLTYDPKHPQWPNRDRFVLSAGHGSMLLYSLLYLTGYEDITLDDLKNFRQLGAKTAGHPEYGHVEGIETTTGPLGQGLANAVGFALAERMLEARFGSELVNHKTYVIAGDGCLMEGISHEAISLAGHLKLNKLIVLFDDNQISIDGPTSLAVSDNMPARFAASGWNTISIDGHDEKAIRKALTQAQTSDRPTMIACRTTIGYGAPKKAGTAGSHGAALGKEEVAGARVKLNWQHEPFDIPPRILEAWREAGARNAKTFDVWKAKEKSSGNTEFERLTIKRPPASWENAVQDFKRSLAGKKPNEATRKSSQEILEVLAPIIPELIGGSADLSGSNNTKAKVQVPITADNFAGRYIHYGVREHAMAAIMNGIALHGEFIPYGGTFLVFADYCRPAIRLAALMQLGVIFVMTHDSIGVGEDGPTHQPIEHMASLRSIPGLQVFRPADATETAECWEIAINSRKTPSVLCLTRQNLPALRTEFVAENLCAKGGYILRDAKDAKVTLIATGSEVSLAVDAQKQLAEKGIAAKVVSMPSTTLFDAQLASYRSSVLGKNTLKVAIEAASGYGWEKYIGLDGIFIGMQGFGASGPAPELYKHFGITAEDTVKAVLKRLA